MGMTLSARNQTLGYLLTTGSVPTRPTSWQVCLHSGDPGDTGLNEVADANYVRQAATFDADLVDGAVSNDAEIVFPAADAGYTFSFISVVDNAGNFLLKQALPATRSITAGNSPRIATGELIIGGSV